MESVTELLRVRQHIGKLTPTLAHHGEDVVARAVENASHAGDAVARKAFTQRLDHRDTARHSRFEGKRGPGLLGQCGQIATMHGDQRLVGRHHRLASGQSRLHQTTRRTI